MWTMDEQRLGEELEIQNQVCLSYHQFQVTSTEACADKLILSCRYVSETVLGSTTADRPR